MLEVVSIIDIESSSESSTVRKFLTNNLYVQHRDSSFFSFIRNQLITFVLARQTFALQIRNRLPVPSRSKQSDKSCDFNCIRTPVSSHFDDHYTNSTKNAINPISAIRHCCEIKKLEWVKTSVLHPVLLNSLKLRTVRY